MKDQVKAAVAVLRAKQAAAYLGIGESTLWRKAKAEPGLLQPIRLGPGTTVWRIADLDAYLQQCADGNHERRGA
ncbi:MAG TPA: hypothetical protein VF445_07830 [Bordetella sp.]|uniref:helix-turn-helix transcriptional regulator n=1 Tax=Bordetella sp. TaxID=28081 RepID=UPI002ED34C03